MIKDRYPPIGQAGSGDSLSFSIGMASLIHFLCIRVLHQIAELHHIWRDVPPHPGSINPTSERQGCPSECLGP